MKSVLGARQPLPRSSRRHPAIVILLVQVALGFPAAVPGQQERPDRWRHLLPQTSVSDDPRRVPIAPGPQGPDGSIVLRGGRVFDGSGSPARPGTVLIERNRISAILGLEDSSWPPDARVIDVQGKTVMPGLIDLHTHLTSLEMGVPAGQGSEHNRSAADATLRAVERLRLFIQNGVTAIRDVGSHGDVPFRLKEWVRERRLSGPRIFAAGLFITGTGGHAMEGIDPGSTRNSWARLASGPDGWREAVRQEFNKGA